MDTKRQIQFKGIRYNTINVKDTKFDVNVSEMQNLLKQLSTLEREHSKSVFNSGECLITETTERQKYRTNSMYWDR